MKIIVCSLAINESYRNIVKYSLKNFNYYCNLHNYELIIYTEKDTIYDSKRAPCWYKIKTIKKILEEKECDYIVWIDADCQILKHNIKLEYFIEKYIHDDYYLGITQDTSLLNTGIMFIKNNEFNNKLMDIIWEYPRDDYFLDFHEQTVLEELYKNNENIRKHINIVPYGIKDELVVYWGNYYPGKNFILHAARCAYFGELSFMYMMDLYYPFKMDEENDDEYNERMTWLNKTCRIDLDGFLRGENIPRKYSARCKKIFNL